MQTLQETLDMLRGRVQRVRGGRPTATVAEEIGISRPTLMAFLHGKPSTTVTLGYIERWVEQQEGTAKRG